MEFLNNLFGEINSVLWGVFILIPLLCGTGIFYTIKLRFVQLRLFPLALRFLFNNATLFGKRADRTGMSSFQALATVRPKAPPPTASGLNAAVKINSKAGRI